MKLMPHFPVVEVAPDPVSQGLGEDGDDVHEPALQQVRDLEKWRRRADLAAYLCVAVQQNRQVHHLTNRIVKKNYITGPNFRIS